jgi:putative heme transporter
MADTDDDPSDGDDRKGWLPSPVSKALKILVLALVVEYLVLPQLGGAREALEVIGDVSPALLGLGVLLQGGAYLGQAQLIRSMLPSGERPGLGTTLRIELSGRAVSHVIPGGTAAGTAVSFRLLQRWGIRGADAGFAMGTQGIGSAVVLNTILWLALLVSIPLRGFDPIYWLAALLGVVVIGGFAGMVLMLMRAEDRSARIVRAVVDRIPLLEPDKAVEVLHRIAERLHQLAEDPPLVRRAIGWAGVHWLCDAASLWVFLAAFGQTVSPDILLVAFGIANVLAAIPISPRGLGVVEAVLITGLVGFGVPSSEAVIGVVSYRLVNFWIPIPLGAASYLSLSYSLSDKREPVRDTLGGLAEEAAEQAENIREWAADRGLRVPGQDTS